MPENNTQHQAGDIHGPFPLGRFWCSKWGLLLLVLLVCGTIYAVRPKWQETQGLIFGTEYHIKYKYHHNLQADIDSTLKSVDTSLSLFNKNSTLSRINNGETNQGDSLFVEVFKKAEEISQITNGAFDITVAPLVNAWGFGFKQGHVLTQQEVDSLRQYIGYEKVRLDGDKIIKSQPQIMLDCGAIAKGYGVDRVAKMLRSKGIDNFLVEIGGEVVANGHNSEGKEWSVGIQKPIDDKDNSSTELQSVLSISNVAIATSGNYRNYYMRDGRKYAHTIDPRNGFPVQHSLLSATVFALDCATADAYATAFMVLGIEEAKNILAKHPELRAYFIYDNGKNLEVWQSEGLHIENLSE